MIPTLKGQFTQIKDNKLNSKNFPLWSLFNSLTIQDSLQHCEHHKQNPAIAGSRTSIKTRKDKTTAICMVRHHHEENTVMKMWSDQFSHHSGSLR